MNMPNPSGRGRPGDTATGLTVADAALLISQHAKADAKRMHGICDRIRQHVDESGQKALTADLIGRIAAELDRESERRDAATSDNRQHGASLGDQTAAAKSYPWLRRRNRGKRTVTIEIVSVGAAAMLIIILAFRPDLIEQGIAAIGGTEPDTPNLAENPAFPVAERALVAAAPARPADDPKPAPVDTAAIDSGKFAALAPEPLPATVDHAPALAALSTELASIKEQRDGLLKERLALLKDRDGLRERVAAAAPAKPVPAPINENQAIVKLRSERNRLAHQVETLLISNKHLEDGLSRASVSNLESQREIAGHLTDMAGLRVERNDLARRVERSENLLADQSAKRAGQVERLLKRSRQQLSAGKYIEPIGDNAVETLHQVLLLHPRHTEALRGTDTIKREFRRLAGLAAAARDWFNALAYYRTVQRIDPSDTKVASEILAIIERQRSDPRRADLDARQ
jgi:hypothetical protein